MSDSISLKEEDMPNNYYDDYYPEVFDEHEDEEIWEETDE